MASKGYIDLHVHGAGSFTTRGTGASQARGMARLLGSKGVRAFLPAVYAAPIDAMRKNMEAIRQAMGRPREAGMAEILGVYLEGPFLNPSRAGAQDKDALISPSLGALGKLLKGYEDIVRIITVAPELKGALRVIERCSSMGIRVNMGHSDATYGQGLDGKMAGATGVTHIFNAMRPFHHREPGLPGLGLLDDDLYVEVIADGVHLSPSALGLVFRAKRSDRIVLVSDSIKGPMYKKGVLQGGKSAIADACRLLADMGMPARTITMAAKENPARYLGLERGACIKS